MSNDNKPDDAEFMRMVADFWRHYGDPTRYSFWDADRCAKLMPDFFHSWMAYRVYEHFAEMAVKDLV